MDIPGIRIELEGIKRSIQSALLHFSDDLNRMVLKTTEATVTEEWVAVEIKTAVDTMRSTIESAVVSQLEKGLRRKRNERE